MNGILTLEAQLDVAGAGDAGAGREIGADAAVVTVRGRAAWALMELINGGHRGCSYIENPAPRWSGYIHKLRKLGIRVETVRETHGGLFPGKHARYVLRSRITIVEVSGQLVAAAA